MPHTDMESKVLEVLEDSNTPLRPEQVAARLEDPSSMQMPNLTTIRQALEDLDRQGLVEDNDTGAWVVTDSNKAALSLDRRYSHTDPTSVNAIFEEFDQAPTPDEDAAMIRELSIAPGFQEPDEADEA